MCISYLPVLQARNDMVLGYLQYQFEHRPPPKKSVLDNVKDSGVDTYSGVVKAPAARRLQKAIDILLQTSTVKMVNRPGGKKFPFRLSFATLTIPGKIQTIAKVRKVFASFTAWLRYAKVSYVWKVEFQKRGQLHYHLILNRYLPWKEITHAWNSRMKKAGFLNEWAKEHGHFMPNSVDVRSVRMDKGKAMSKYLAKYLAKDLENEKGQKVGKWWGASRNLNVKRFVFEGSSTELSKLASAKQIVDDNWILYLVDPMKIMEKGTMKNYKKWKKEIRSNI